MESSPSPHARAHVLFTVLLAVLLVAGATIGVTVLQERDATLRALQADLAAATRTLGALEASVNGRMAGLTSTVQGINEEVASVKSATDAVRTRTDATFAALRAQLIRVRGGTAEGESLPALAESAADAIVLVVCSPDGEQMQFGSGSIATPTGTVLTNAHVIDVGVALAPGDETPCAVLYRPSDEAHRATFAATLSHVDADHDLAVLQLIASEEGQILPRFASIDGAMIPTCATEEIRVAQQVLILGYPSYADPSMDPTFAALKVTRGSVSAILEDGNILTDAKIEHGNSGGAALLETGCFIGVPTAVLAGSLESMGMIVRLP